MARGRLSKSQDVKLPLLCCILNTRFTSSHTSALCCCNKDMTVQQPGNSQKTVMSKQMPTSHSKKSTAQVQSASDSLAGEKQHAASMQGMTGSGHKSAKAGRQNHLQQTLNGWRDGSSQVRQGNCCLLLKARPGAKTPRTRLSPLIRVCSWQVRSAGLFH